MEDKMEDYIDKKVEEITSSPSYLKMSSDEKTRVSEKIKIHLERMVVETFVNRLDEDQAVDLSNLMDKDPEKAYQKLLDLSGSIPGLANDLEERLERETQKFKSL